MKRLFSAATALSFCLILLPAPAMAHDEVVGTYPTAGSTVQAGAIDISIDFNEAPIATADSQGLVIEVTDPSGNKLTGCPMAMGTSLMDSFTLNQAGKYQVAWRSVSNDGHPSEGTFEFTVDAASANSEPNSAACAIAMSSNVHATPLTTTPKPAASQQDPFITNLPFLFFGMALVVLGAAAGPLTQKLRAKKQAQRAASKKR